jgi:toxin ParE1/3/4
VVQVVWTEPALADLQQVYDFIVRDSPYYAEATVRRLRAAVERLQIFPASGRLVPEFGAPYREVIEGSYRIIYRHFADQDLVLVDAVVHGRRRLPPPIDMD